MLGGGLETGITYISLLLLDLLLDLNLLDKVSALNIEDTMKVDTRLELANHKVVLGIRLDALDLEMSNPGGHLAGKLLGLGVLGLEREGLLAVEGKDLGGRNRVVLVEDGKLGILIRDIGRLLPGELDGVAQNVVDREVTDTEHGGEDGAGKGTSTRNSLILVEGEGEGLAEELGDLLLEGRNTGASTNKLDSIDILDGQASLIKSLLEGDGDALNHGGDKLLELLAL